MKMGTGFPGVWNREGIIAPWAREGDADEAAAVVSGAAGSAVAWVAGYLALGVAGVPLCCWLLGDAIFRSWGLEGDVYGFSAWAKLAGIVCFGWPVWFAGFPAAYHVLGRWMPRRTERFLAAGVVMMALALVAARGLMWIF